MRVMVIGAGTMGAGIAEVSAKSGFDTTLTDMTREFVDRGVAKIEASLK
jgi:3-hydroxybutyryl-CoA dehydrogenase